MAKHMPLTQMAEVFKVMSDPSRLAVLHSLWGGQLFVGDICRKTMMSQPNVSHHLAVLKELQLIKSKKKGRKTYYQIADKHVYTIINQCKEHVEGAIE
jgi:DNA-binding transcriptional ArsR family regulator